MPVLDEPKGDKDFHKAKDYAFRLLSYCSRSTKEIEERLKKRFSHQVVQRTIRHLTKLGYLDDQEFARAWLQAQTRLRPQGLALLRQQLEEKGLPERIIEQAIDDFAGGYDEAQAVQRLVKLRRRRDAHVAPLARKRRLYAYLRRRGFADELIAQVIKNTN